MSSNLIVNNIEVGAGATIYTAASNQLAFGTNGSEKVRIASNGNVRIGSAGAPNIAVGGGLEIERAGAATIRIEDSSSTSGFEIQNTGGVIKQRLYNNQPWTIEYGGGEKLRITSTGKVGIGTNNPAHLLHLEGASPVIQFEDTDNAANIYSLINAGGSAGRLLFQVDPANAGTNSYVAFDIDGGEKLRITSGGHVNIGGNYTQTDNKLDVTGIARITNDAANTATDMNHSGALTLYNVQHAKGSFIDFMAESANGTAGMMAKIGGWNTHAGSGYSGALTFSTRNNSTNTMLERLRIDSDGLLLLGTTDTGFSNGYTTMTIGNTSTQNTGLTIASSASNGYSRLHFADSNSGTAKYAGWIAYSHADDSLLMSTGNSGGTKFRIDSEGSVRIGTAGGYSIWNGLSSDVKVKLEVRCTVGEPAGMALLEERGDSNGASFIIGKSRGGSGAGVINSGDTLGWIKFAGADGTRQHNAAGILAWNNGTVATGRVAGNLSFYTSPDSVSGFQERFRINSSGHLFSTPTYSNTTGNSANVSVPNSDGQFYRSTSSIKYKDNVTTLTDVLADKILSCRPVSYTSKCENDDKTKVFYGLIAEEVDKIDKGLVFYNNESETPEPEGVQYDRFIPALLNLVKRQKAQIETLETKVAALESA